MPCYCDVIYERSLCNRETNPRQSSKCRTTDDAGVIIKKWTEDRIQRIEGVGEGFEPTTHRIPGMFYVNVIIKYFLLTDIQLDENKSSDMNPSRALFRPQWGPRQTRNSATNDPKYK